MALSQFIVSQYLPRGTRALLGRAFHKALELDGAMFAGEVDWPLARALVATKEGVLPNEPAGIAAKQVGIACRVTQRCLACIMGADAGENALELLQAALCVLLDRCGDGGVSRAGIWRRWPIRGAAVPARIIDEHPALALLTERGVPERLDIQVGNDESVVIARPGAVLIPVARIELQEELGNRAVSKLRDSCLLQGVEAGLPEINMP